MLTLTIKQGANDDRGGNVRRIGCHDALDIVKLAKYTALTRMRVKHSVGAATLLTKSI